MIIATISLLSASIDNIFILVEPIEDNSSVVMYYQFISNNDTIKDVIMDIPNDGYGLSMIDYSGINPKDAGTNNMIFDIVKSNASIRFALPFSPSEKEFQREFEYTFVVNKPIDNLAAAIAMPANADSFRTNLENMEDNMPPESGISNTMFYNRHANWEESKPFPIDFSYENPYLRHKFNISNIEYSIKDTTNKYIIAVIVLFFILYVVSLFTNGRKITGAE